MKFGSNIKHFIIFICIILFCTMGCKKSGPVEPYKPPCPPILPGIVPTPPYDSPIWHPSGQFIGFNHKPLREIVYPYRDPCIGEQRFDSDSTGFWLINPNGTNMRRIFSYRLLSPAWSPDGEWIAFTIPIGSEAHIFKMRFTGTTFDTTTVTQLTFEGRNFLPAWSPDGQWIAYDSNAESPNGMNFIWIMGSDGSQKRRIAYEPNQGEIRMPHWSSDSKKIVHIRYLVGTFSSEIFAMDTSGANVVRLTQNSLTDNYPRYSPDGTKIAFGSRPKDGILNIWMINTDETNLRQLTRGGVDATFGLPFSWSPAGDKIIYTRYQSTDWTIKNGVLWLLDVDSGTETQLTFNP